MLKQPSPSLVNELGRGMSLEETSAGRVLVEEKQRRKKAHDEEVQRLEKLIEEEKAKLDVGRGGEAALHDEPRPIVRPEREGHRPVVRASSDEDDIPDHDRRNHDRGGRPRREAGGERGLVGNVLAVVETVTRLFQH